MSNEKWTRGDKRTSPLDQVFQPGLGGKEERERGRTERDREREGFRERGSTFSLEFPAIGPASPDEARSKVAPHARTTRGYQFRGVSTNFGKVGVFLLLALLFV